MLFNELHWTLGKLQHKRNCFFVDEQNSFNKEVNNLQQRKKDNEINSKQIYAAYEKLDGYSANEVILIEKIQNNNLQKENLEHQKDEEKEKEFKLEEELASTKKEIQTNGGMIQQLLVKMEEINHSIKNQLTLANEELRQRDTKRAEETREQLQGKNLKIILIYFCFINLYDLIN